MRYEVLLSRTAEDQLEFFKKSGNKARLRKIKNLFEELEVHPTTGTGKPEPLKGDLSGYYSRRIDGKNRMIYLIDNDKIIVEVLSVKGHYFDK